MGKINICDGCLKQSPRGGLYIANHWAEIKITSIIEKGMGGYIPEKILLCGKCFKERLGDITKTKLKGGE